MQMPKEGRQILGVVLVLNKVGEHQGYAPTLERLMHL